MHCAEQTQAPDLHASTALRLPCSDLLSLYFFVAHHLWLLQYRLLCYAGQHLPFRFSSFSAQSMLILLSTGFALQLGRIHAGQDLVSFLVKCLLPPASNSKLPSSCPWWSRKEVDPCPKKGCDQGEVEGISFSSFCQPAELITYLCFVFCVQEERGERA